VHTKLGIEVCAQKAVSYKITLQRLCKALVHELSSPNFVDSSKAFDMDQRNCGDLCTATSHDPWQCFRQYLASCRHVLVLVGAGLSAPSGIATWRGAGSVWNNIDIKDLSSPYKFKEDPLLVWTFYHERIREVLAAKPNAGHYALADFVKRHGRVLTVNQNIDGMVHILDHGLMLKLKTGLLEDAGHPQSSLCNIHGTLRTVCCVACNFNSNITSIQGQAFLEQPSSSSEPHHKLDLSNLPHCPHCSELLRPHVVWFGERLAGGAPEVIDEWIESGTVDLVIAVGTSFKVFPAAEFVEDARAFGARLAVINANLDDMPVNELDDHDWFFEGDAAEILPLILKLPSISP
jgi:NAD-dependent deacetylase sirtuin 5